ncbi:hypothetical protein UFOVP413_11 [uncultured Caudovirales phage]|uniref:Uncharacterized protein n=1 Tax=uncultured Caudovirales phage TaxID=2100421 RepID=A0A6J5M6D7_9CAUD|nr:hypothetical protein UFOVP413_11 [uncultured Caudovirales phage]
MAWSQIIDFKEVRDEFGAIIESKKVVTEKFDPAKMTDLGRKSLDFLAEILPAKTVLWFLQDLARHKRYGGNAEFFSTVTADIANEIGSIERGALILACHHFKFSTESPWFPMSGEIVARIRQEAEKIQHMRRLIENYHAPEIEKSKPAARPKEKPWSEITPRERAEFLAIQINSPFFGCKSGRAEEFLRDFAQIESPPADLAVTAKKCRDYLDSMSQAAAPVDSPEPAEKNASTDTKPFIS